MLTLKYTLTHQLMTRRTDGASSVFRQTYRNASETTGFNYYIIYLLIKLKISNFVLHNKKNRNKKRHKTLSQTNALHTTLPTSINPKKFLSQPFSLHSLYCNN